MRRKIIKQGMGGYTITLPIKWIREQNIESLPEIDVTETEQGLLLSAKSAKKETKTQVDLSLFDERMILNILNQLYRVGYDTLSLHFKNENQYKQIERIVKDVLLGCEIVQKKENNCEIQNIAEPEEEKFDVILRRIFLQIKEIGAFVLENMQSKKIRLSDADSSKTHIDKLTNYARRTIIRTKKGGQRNVLLYAVVTQLSLISHSYYYFYEYYCSQKSRPEKEILDMLAEMNQLYVSFYEAFYKKDLFALNKLSERKNTFFKETNHLLEKNKGATAVYIYYLRELMRLQQMAVPSTIGAII